MKPETQTHQKKSTPPAIRAVIDIGATAARMMIAEIDSGNPARTLEFLEQSVNLGRDTFSSGKISSETIEACVRVCRDFSEMLRQYQITDPACVRAVATSAVAEAANSDVLLDRIFMASGINVEVIDTAEINRLTYFSILPLLQMDPSLCKGNLLAVEVGGGNTTALGLRDGTVLFAHTYRFGSFRTREMLEDVYLPTARFRDLIEGEIRTGIRPIIEPFANEKEMKILILGGDARLAADQIKPGWNSRPSVSLRVSTLARFTDQSLEMPVEELVKEYHLPFAAAESLGPALLVMQSIPQMLNCKTVYIGASSMRDGLLQEMAAGGAWDERFTQQIIHSAVEIGRRYQFDQDHAENVAARARDIFRVMQDEHKMLPRYETILTVAALLHDIGTFISNRSHHKHSRYLIENSDIFGLSQQDRTITALTVRYHRSALPRSTHTDYTRLTRVNRLRVSKLAAILRVADGLDRGHVQRIRNPQFLLFPDRLQIGVSNLRDCAVEEIAVSEKSDLFEQVYGKRALLVKRSPRRK
ncbi:MAG: exopolyphosphatase / guanosine-5-triphosphate,3-diphosphate pyrophosphatase [Verrucomicrobiota bacterium]|jgi:exopolyphosphatase/guanosine-5'-triphosphate,3'-diphosphate pyrophosphatase|nr:exopolyphosphatase / guanosine-5-triphosphate,3-diphosphate pyrophosphatase [Verrucomicrobiota bacterium]